MQKLLSLVLLVLFGMPLLLAVATQGASAEASLPACCRRGGAHHCSMGMVLPARGTVVRAHCPFEGAATPLAHCATLLVVAVGLLVSALCVNPNGVVQTESRRRIARDRSRQKRGPPRLTPVLA